MPWFWLVARSMADISAAVTIFTFSPFTFWPFTF
jgi:hypothetical protein